MLETKKPANIKIPEPDLTPQEMIARAAALRPKLRAQQDENDERGTYSEELHQDFLKAGFYRIPASAGASGSPPRTPSRSPRTGPSRRRSSSSAMVISSRRTARRPWGRSRRWTAAI